ncbi:MAG TPA: hypothetical protein VNK82_02275 [Terriglobales bacterium]|nr:hypothetical protein [Terriglobales bacterium]
MATKPEDPEAGTPVTSGKNRRAPLRTAAYFCGRALLNRKITRDARRCALCGCAPAAPHRSRRY